MSQYQHRPEGPFYEPAAQGWTEQDGEMRYGDPTVHEGPQAAHAGLQAHPPSRRGEDSATIFVPPEVYHHMLTSSPEDPPSSQTLCSARGEEVPHGQRSFAMPAMTSDPRAGSAPRPVTPNGTILMRAFPYQPPRAEEPRVEVVAPSPMPESARVRRALDEMSMVIDIDSMQRKVASASDDEMARYVDALRRSEGIAPAPVAAPQMGHPQAMHHAYPQAGWQPGMYPAPVVQYAPQSTAIMGAPAISMPMGVHGAPVMMPAGAGPRSQPPAQHKHSTATLMTLFAVMFLMTMVGIGALTYVALRSGHVATRAAVTTRAVD